MAETIHTTTITAQFTAVLNKYSVVFLDWDGTELKSQMVEYGKSATAPAAPTRPADENYTYTFKGWDTDFSSITGDTVVTAEYTTTELITIFFTNTRGWSKVYCASWYDGATAPNPGTAMTYYSTNSYGSDVYCIKVPADIDNIKFSGGAGKDETVVITTGITDNIGFYPSQRNADKTLSVESYLNGEAEIPPYVEFDFEMDVTVPNLVEIGSDAVINATTNSTESVTYELYTSDGKKVSTNTTGVFSVSTAGSEIGTKYTYYVVATTVVDAETHTLTSEEVTYTVTSQGDTWTATIYFKSSSSLGYLPLMTTEGAVADLADYDMQKALLLGTNEAQNGFYYWYRANVVVDKDSPTINVRILSRRYAMEGNITLTIDDMNTEFWLGVDNLNSGTNMVDLTDCSAQERNWFSSAVNMVYDAAVDGKLDITDVSANVVLRSVGDSNNDGIVNIKDATLVQKHLAGIITMTKLDENVSDTDNDYRLTVRDATTIQKKIAGLI